MIGIISVLIIEQGRVPRIERILNTPNVFEHVVGGSYSVGLFPDQDVGLIYCDGGRRQFAPPETFGCCAQDYVDGTSFLCGLDCTGFCSLTPSQQRFFANLYRDHPPFMMLDSGTGQKVICATVGDLAKAVCNLWERMKAGQTVRLFKWNGVF